jgi:hypothetical protein
MFFQKIGSKMEVYNQGKVPVKEIIKLRISLKKSTINLKLKEVMMMKWLVTKQAAAIVAIATVVLLCQSLTMAVDMNDPNANNLFDPNRVLTIYIDMDPCDWEVIRVFCPNDDGHCSETNNPYYEAELTCGDVGPMLVAIHRKSDIGEPNNTNPQKVSLKVDINRIINEQSFAGKDKLSLEMGATGSVVTEGMAWHIYRRTGILSPRSAWVKVYVNGDYKGLYSNVEQIDKEFLSDNGITDTGWLYKREDYGEAQRTHEVPFMPNPFRFNWYPFDHPADVTEIPTPTDWLTQALWRVNMPHLLKLAVAESFVANGDALVMKGARNYWYYDWSTNPNDINDPNFQQPRLYFAWDLDTTLGSKNTYLPIMNTPSPQGGGPMQNGLINELTEAGAPLGYPTFQADYLNTYVNQLNGPLELSSLIAEVNSIEPVISPAMNSDPYQQAGTAAAEFQRIRDFLTARTNYVNAQLSALAPLPGTFLLDDGYEGTTWDANWNDTAHTWTRGTDLRHSGAAAAKKVANTSGNFTSDSLNASDANTIHVRFWYNLDDTEGTDLRLYFYNGSAYVEQTSTPAIADGAEDTWLCYVATVTNSQYFVSNFQIRFAATLGNGENVWIDDVEITKEVPQLTAIISGDILDPGTAPVAGVSVDANNAGGSDITDVNGQYSLSVNYDWSGTVTPTRADYNFAPTNTVYNNVTSNQSAQDYTATHICDLYPDGVIDFHDLDVLCEAWLTSDPDADFNDDNIVNFADYEKFSQNW